MKTVLFLVVLYISLASSLFIVAYAQEGVTTKALNGESYKVEFYGNLILGPDRLLSSAMMQGKGQYLLTEKILVTSGKVTEISTQKPESLLERIFKASSSEGDLVLDPYDVLVIQINGTAKVFKLTKITKICDGSELLEPGDIKKDDMVTITSKIDQQTALSLRKGPMLFGGIMSSGLVLKKYECVE